LQFATGYFGGGGATPAPISHFSRNEYTLVSAFPPNIRSMRRVFGDARFAGFAPKENLFCELSGHC